MLVAFVAGCTIRRLSWLRIRAATATRAHGASGRWPGTRPHAGSGNAAVDFFSVSFILEMHLKINDGGIWAGRVELARTVETPDSRKIHELDAGGYGLFGANAGHSQLCLGVHGAVAHGAFKEVLGIRFSGLSDGLGEPFRRGRLLWFGWSA